MRPWGQFTGLFGIGIGNAEPGQYLGFETFHFQGLVLFEMIIAQNVQKAMHNQMGEMIFKAGALFFGLAHKRFPRQRDVAQNADDRLEGLYLGEAQHVRGRVLAPVLGIELPLFGIVGEQDRDLGGTLDPGLGAGKGGENRAFGQGVKMIGPVIRIADDGNFQRRGAQLAFPSAAFCRARRRAVSAS